MNGEMLQQTLPSPPRKSRFMDMPHRLQAGHGHSAHDHMMNPGARANHFEMEVPPCLTGNCIIGTLVGQFDHPTKLFSARFRHKFLYTPAGLVLFVSLPLGTTDAWPWAPVACAAVGASTGLWCIGSSHHACQPATRIPLVVGVALFGAFVVAIMQGAGGSSPGFDTTLGCIVFGCCTSCFSSILFSVMRHTKWWKKVGRSGRLQLQPLFGPLAANRADLVTPLTSLRPRCPLSPFTCRCALARSCLSRPPRATRTRRWPTTSGRCEWVWLQHPFFSSRVGCFFECGAPAAPAVVLGGANSLFFCQRAERGRSPKFAPGP